MISEKKDELQTFRKEKEPCLSSSQKRQKSL